MEVGYNRRSNMLGETMQNLVVNNLLVTFLVKDPNFMTASSPGGDWLGFYMPNVRTTKLPVCRAVVKLTEDALCQGRCRNCVSVHQELLPIGFFQLSTQPAALRGV